MTMKVVQILTAYKTRKEKWCNKMEEEFLPLCYTMYFSRKNAYSFSSSGKSRE